jgi:hypothetical protein
MSLNRAQIERLRDEGSRAPSNAADQIEGAMQLEIDAFGRARDYSPHARWHPTIAQALDEVRDDPTTLPSSDWLESNGFHYIHSNLPDREPVPFTEEGHDHNVVGIDHAERVRDYRLGVANSICGPHGLRAVRLVDPNVPLYSPSLPWKWTEGCEITPTQVLFPVAYGWTTDRVARMALSRYSKDCHWTNRRPQVGWHKCNGVPDYGLLVSCGAITFTFPTCWSCREAFAKDVTRGGWNGEIEDDDRKLDYASNDGWDRLVGWPADRWR